MHIRASEPINLSEICPRQEAVEKGSMMAPHGSRDISDKKIESNLLQSQNSLSTNHNFPRDDQFLPPTFNEQSLLRLTSIDPPQYPRHDSVNSNLLVKRL
jgi:hypothetical protein